MLFHQFYSTVQANCTEREVQLVEQWKNEIEYFLDLGEKGWRSGDFFLDYGISDKFQFKLTFITRKQRPFNVAERLLKPFTHIKPWLDYAISDDCPCQVGITLKESEIEYELYFKSEIAPCAKVVKDDRLEGVTGSPFLIGIDSNNALSVYIENDCDQDFMDDCAKLFELENKKPEEAAFYSHYKRSEAGWTKSKNGLEFKPIEATDLRKLEAVENTFFKEMIPTTGTLHYVNYCSLGDSTGVYFPVYPSAFS